MPLSLFIYIYIYTHIRRDLSTEKKERERERGREGERKREKYTPFMFRGKHRNLQFLMQYDQLITGPGNVAARCRNGNTRLIRAAQYSGVPI